MAEMSELLASLSEKVRAVNDVVLPKLRQRESDVLELRKAVSALLSMNGNPVHDSICRQIAQEALRKVPE